MKTLLILLFPLLTFGQSRTWEHGLKMQSGFYPKSEFSHNKCLFEAFNGGKEIILKIHTKKPIIGGVKLITNKVNYKDSIIITNAFLWIKSKTTKRIYYNEIYGLNIDGINKNGFYIVKMPFYLLDFWEAADKGIILIEFNTGKQFEQIEINDNLIKLKEYAR